MRQKFDSAFVQRLRHEVGDGALDVAWYPQEQQLSQAVSSTGAKIGWRANGRRGCWVVTKTIKVTTRTEAHGAEFLAPHTMTVKVFKLNGKYGHPRLPGHWTIRQMCLADVCRRGAMNRLRELNAWQEASLRAKYVEEHGRVAEQLASTELRSALMKLNDELGVERHTKEEHLAAWAQVEKKAEAAHNAREDMVKAERLL